MICPNCRNSSYYWKKKGLAAKRARYAALQFYQSRIEYYDPRVAKNLNDARRAVNAAKERATEQRAAVTQVSAVH